MKTKSIAMTALMTALLVILGLLPPIPLGFIPVPIVLQNLGVMLVALFLGGKRGTLSMILLLVLGLFLPVFSGGRMTPDALAGQSAGYVLVWVLVPSALALLNRLMPSSHFVLRFLKIWLAGVLLVDVLGGVYLAWFTKQSLLQGIVLSNLAFLPLDTIKAFLATYLAGYLKKRLK